MVFAPGEEIETVCYGNTPDDPPAQCKPSGTSVAAPQASKLAALLASAKPDLSPQEIKNILVHTTYDEEKIDYMAALGEALDWQHLYLPALHGRNQ